MPEKAGLEIHADLAAFRKELQQARADMRDFNGDMLKGATGVKTFEDASKKASVASQAFGSALGFLGANSITGVISKMISFGKEAVTLARNLQAVENRAKALFGDAFSQMEKGAQALGQQFQRSASDILEMQTGFGLLLDSAGASQKQVQQFSAELTKLTLVIGKAFPAISDQEIFQKLQAGIMGSSKALRELGIVMKNNDLEEFARSQKIKLKLKDMDSEQQMMLRIMYLTEQANTLQEAANANTSEGVDASKQFQSSWKDISEEIGTVALPAINLFFTSLANGLRVAIDGAKQLGTLIANIATFSAFSGLTSDVNALQEGATLTSQNAALQIANAQRYRSTGKMAAPKEKDNFWENRSGGGGKSRADLEKDLAAAEEKIISALKEQADENKKNLDTTKRALEIKMQMGTITSTERKELENINKRLVEQKDHVDELVTKWKNAKDKVTDLWKKVKDINQEIADENADKAKSLDDLSKDTADKKAGKVADLVKELKDIESKLRNGEGNQVDLQNRRSQIDAMIDPLRGTAEGQAILKAGETQAGMNDFQQIDADAAKKKQEIEDESKRKMIKLQEELKTAEQNLASAVQQEAQARNNVSAALTEQKATQDRVFPGIEKATQDHVAKEVEQWEKLKKTLDAVATSYSKVGAGPAAPAPAPGHAAGGPIVGAGGPTSDSILSRLSNGEHVLTAADVNALGGQAGVLKFRQMLHSPIRTVGIPRFATGGPVTNHHEKTVNFNMHNHGDAARAFTDPRLAAFLVRTSF